MPCSLTSWNFPYRVLAALAVITLTQGCSLCPTLSAHTPEAVSPEPVPVIRGSRYTLVEVRPNDAQNDLMQQVVDFALPVAESPTVGDALQGILLRSGYRLCLGHEDTQALAALPLPAVQNPLGPMTLRQALEVLGGRGWQLEVNESIREVCFARGP